MLRKFIFLLSVFFSFTGMSQNSTSFIVLDEADQNIHQNIEKFKGQGNYFVTNGISENALVQISKAIGDGKIDHLKIYVSTKPGAIVFSSVAINNETLLNLKPDFIHLSEKINNSIEFVGEADLFSGEEGAQLKSSLESITNLTIYFTKTK